LHKLQKSENKKKYDKKYINKCIFCEWKEFRETKKKLREQQIIQNKSKDVMKENTQKKTQKKTLKKKENIKKKKIPKEVHVLDTLDKSPDKTIKNMKKDPDISKIWRKLFQSKNDLKIIHKTCI
jgi:3-methyladenine DNA glycosylase/8-oxoguanine DNA glycosylase